MHKTLTVNISGQMFVLDEEAFVRMKQYLLDLRKHFTGRQGEREIISDIESRIAELLQQLLTDQKQVIDLYDVEKIIAVMGQPWQIDENEASDEDATLGETQSYHRLYRHLDEAQLAGVAAGLAHFFGIDPVMIRILFVLLLFVGGTGALVYLLLWLLVPVGPDSVDDMAAQTMSKRRKLRRLFRESKHKKIAGVSAGLGQYFDVDPLIFRILFVIFTFISGFGLLVYLVLWIITPEAKTTADRLRMKGRPVDVENIERTVKEEAERLGKAVNRMGAEAGRGLRRAGREAAPLFNRFINAFVRIISVVVGLLLALTGISLLMILLWLVLGFDNLVLVDEIQLPVVLNSFWEILVPEQDLAQLAGISFWVFMFVPVISLIYVSIRLMAGPAFKLSGFGHLAGVLWVLSLIGLGYSAFSIAADFRETAKTELLRTPIRDSRQLVVLAKEAEQFSACKVLTIDNQRIVFSGENKNQFLGLMPHFYVEVAPNGELPQLLVESVARGSDEDLAQMRSRNISFPLQYHNDTLVLPMWFSIDGKDGLRGQRINLRLSLPDSAVISFDKKLERFFDLNPRSFWRKDQLAGKKVMFTYQGVQGLDK